MNFKIIDKKLKDIEADCEIILTDNLNHKWVEDKKLLEKIGFEPKDEELIYLPQSNKVYVALESTNDDDIRNAVSKAFNTVIERKYKSIKIGLYGNGRAICEGIMLGSYSFKKYKSKKEDKRTDEILISTESFDNSKIDIKDIQNSIDMAQIIAKATNEAKDIVNTTPADMTPEKLANYAKEISKELDLECFIGDIKFLEKEKMGAFLAVAQASINEPKLIHLSYKPKNPKFRVVFVGKGLTYDSGGLSLKPSDYMVTMKSDKSGASAVLHIIKAIAMLKLPIEVHSIIGAAENMIGGNAYKPDDVLKARNGKTIEVRNTDAEGRLVLADCLDYAQDLKPDYLIDLATLTGACVVALGEYTSGVMGHSSSLKHSFVSSALKSGELVGTLPFNKYLKKLLKSSVADISNISSSRYGGAITAALFLDNFIKDEYKQKWLHIDIAGPAYIEKEWGYNQFGASGAGVRMCVEWCIKKSKEEDK